MAFEEAFGIEVPDEDAEKMTTVKDAVDYIDKTRQREVTPLGNTTSFRGAGIVDSPSCRHGCWIGLRAGHRHGRKLEEPSRRGSAVSPPSPVLIPPASIAASPAKSKNFDPFRWIEKKKN